MVGSKDWAKLRKILNVTDSELQSIVLLIKSLKHNPACEFGKSIDITLVPDVIVENRIAEPKRIGALYASLPHGARNAIERRDG
jgi:DNA-directed RNA polymerase specialized sigma54-like protein